MRVAAAMASLVAALGVAPAAAAPTFTDVCAITDTRAMELSGLVATANGYVTVNDSNFDPNRMRIFYVDRSCRITKATPYPTIPRDPEDLTVAADGSLWVGDIGDNLTSETRRTTIALWKVPDNGTPVIYRLTYPDGPHDAEALLFDGDGLPVIATKEIGGAAGLYKPTIALQPNTTAGVPMARVGEFRPLVTGADNPLGTIGENFVTGAATSPDRKRIALRTYTAAYEWDVPDGNVVKAITKTTPRVTELPDEAQGEAIAYTTDGREFLTVSDRADGPATIRRITPSTQLMTTPGPTGIIAGAPPPRVPDEGFFAGIPLWVSIAVGAAGILLAGLGFLGARRSRRSDRPKPTATGRASLPTQGR